MSSTKRQSRVDYPSRKPGLTPGSTVMSSNNGPTTTSTLWVTATLHLTASTKRYESTISTPTQVATTIFLSTASTETSSKLPVATIAGAAGGGVSVLVILVVTVTLCRKSKRKRKSAKRDETYESAWDNKTYPTINSRMFFGDYKPKQMLDQFENGTNTLYGTLKSSDTNDSALYGSDTYDQMFKRAHNNVEYVTKNPLHLDEENPTSYDFKF